MLCYLKYNRIALNWLDILCKTLYSEFEEDH